MIATLRWLPRSTSPGKPYVTVLLGLYIASKFIFFFWEKTCLNYLCSIIFTIIIFHFRLWNMVYRQLVDGDLELIEWQCSWQIQITSRKLFCSLPWSPLMKKEEKERKKKMKTKNLQPIGIQDNNNNPKFSALVLFLSRSPSGFYG